jgi:hypothetical protein
MDVIRTRTAAYKLSYLRFLAVDAALFCVESSSLKPDQAWVHSWNG